RRQADAGEHREALEQREDHERRHDAHREGVDRRSRRDGDHGPLAGVLMRRRLALAIALVVVAVAGACGDDASPPTYGITAGRRLEPRFWDAGGGARLFRMWFDRELGAECHFELAADGRFRCLPDVYYQRKEFADASCTRMVVIAPECEPAPTFAWGYRRMTPSCGRS